MSYMSRTVADVQAPLVALEQVRRAFPYLPAPEFQVSGIFPGQLAISLHDDLADFEAWRVALGVPTSDVSYGTQPGNGVLEASVKWGGADVALTGYGPLPLNDSERGAR